MKNNRLVIITPSYNRPDNLKSLFVTLSLQTQKNFLWLIVDDGSPQGYEEVIDEIRKKADFDVSFYKKDNSGKSSTLNFAINKIEDADFILIVDDDELLFPNSVSIVMEYVSKYMNTDCGMIDFNRESLEGKVISNFEQKEDFFMTVQKRRALGYSSDGYTGYFFDKLSNLRFPVFEGEKYVAPSVLSLLVSQKYKLLWAKASIGKTEYREDGITKSGRKMRLKSPCGMTYHALLMQHRDTGIKCRFVYSVLGYAYMSFSGRNISEVKDEFTKDYSLMPICKPFGYLLSRYWKLKI